jgi:DNA invertase Pin-like site-specific DNA recombinase
VGTEAVRADILEQRGQTKAGKKTAYGEAGKKAYLVGFSEGEETMTIRVAVYARVSTLNNGQNPEVQLRELKEYCQHRGWTITGEYVDCGISGAKDSRPELNRLMADAHKRRFDVVCVFKFDRFARSVSHLLRALETFKALGIEFCSFSEQMDTSTPTGKMIFTVLGAVAELERSLIAERVRAGLRNARAKGKRLGRPRSQVSASQIRELLAAGQNMEQVGSTLGISAATVCRRARSMSALVAR